MCHGNEIVLVCLTPMTSSLTHRAADCVKCSICPCRCCVNKRRNHSHLKATDPRPERRSILILVRHGSSVDEVEKRYTGWTDADLSKQGHEEMQRAGQALRQGRFSLDLCFTSLLKRAIKSLFLIQEELNYLWLPVTNSWRLNDRMLGSLTGFHRDRAEALFGQNQLKEWLTRPDLAPPGLEESNPLHPRLNPKFRSIQSIVPSTETLLNIRQRLIPFFYDQLLTNLYSARNILLVTHEDIVKEIIRLLNDYRVDEFTHHEVPVGVPIIFEFSTQTKALLTGYYLSSPLFENDQKRLFPTGFETQPSNVVKKDLEDAEAAASNTPSYELEAPR